MITCRDGIVEVNWNTLMDIIQNEKKWKAFLYILKSNTS